MKQMHVVPIFATLVLAVACSKDDPTNPGTSSPKVASVIVSASTTSLRTGESAQLSATATTASGQVVSGAQFAWGTDAPDVAAVDATGRVTAMSPGTAAISATAGTVRGVVTLTVTAPVPQTASVRFVNAITDMTGSGGFTTNGQFTTGSALAFGLATSTCTTVSAGSTSFGFGAANPSGTALSGNALATLSSQTLMGGGEYIVVATGSVTSPTLFLLDNTFPGTLGAGSAAVRFLNFAPGTTSGSENTFVVYLPELGPGSTPFALDLALGAPTAFKIVASGPTTYTLMQNPGHNIVSPSGTVTLQAASVNTFAIIPGSGSVAYRAIQIPRC